MRRESFPSSPLPRGGWKGKQHWKMNFQAYRPLLVSPGDISMFLRVLQGVDSTTVPSQSKPGNQTNVHEKKHFSPVKLAKGVCVWVCVGVCVCEREREKETERGNRQNRLYLESRTPCWARPWTLSYMPSIYGNNTQTRKPGPRALP